MIHKSFMMIMSVGLISLFPLTVEAQPLFEDDYEDGIIHPRYSPVGSASLTEAGGLLEVTYNATGEGLSIDLTDIKPTCIVFEFDALHIPTSAGDTITISVEHDVSKTKSGTTVPDVPHNSTLFFLRQPNGKVIVQLALITDDLVVIDVANSEPIDASIAKMARIDIVGNKIRSEWQDENGVFHVLSSLDPPIIPPFVSAQITSTTSNVQPTSIDHFTALELHPVPTLTEWGMIIFCVLLFSWMAWVIVGRRKQLVMR